MHTESCPCKPHCNVAMRQGTCVKAKAERGVWGCGVAYRGYTTTEGSTILDGRHPILLDAIGGWYLSVVSDVCYRKYFSLSNVSWGAYLGVLRIHPAAEVGMEQPVPLWTWRVQSQSLSFVSTFKQSFRERTRIQARKITVIEGC